MERAGCISHPIFFIEGIEKLHGDINFDRRWSTGFYRATSADRVARLYVHDFTLWDQLSAGKVKTIGNSIEIENSLRNASAAQSAFPANYYSTITRSPPGKRSFPNGIRSVSRGWTNTIHVPSSAAPSPDTDAQLAIMQPSGLVLECYDAVVCGNGDIVCTMASFSDPTGDGTGENNGRCASLLDNYAGLIRKGEIAGGRIPHALSCTMSRLLLAPRFVWPAYAFDMNDRYEGKLPMGSQLAIPSNVDLHHLGLSKSGLVIARAAQEFGIYIVDRGGDGGMTLKAALDAEDALYANRSDDVEIILRQLRGVPARSPRPTQ